MKVHRKIRLAALLLAGIMLLSGCRVGDTEVEFLQPVFLNQIFKIDGESCSKKEAKIYLTNYMNIYGNAFGINLQEQDFEMDSLEQYAKDMTLLQLARIKCMNGIAKDEKEKAKKAAEEYYQSLSKEERNYLRASKSRIEKMYLEYMTAEKVYRTLIGSVNEEVSDDEARIMEAVRIFVKEKDKAKELQKRLKKGEDFSALAGTYNEKGRAEVKLGREDLPEEVAKEAFELENEQISSMLTAKDGYYFIKCLNKYNKELTDQNKEVILKERRESAFRAVYDEYVEKVPTVLNKRVWEHMSVKPGKKVKTDSFFEVIDRAIQQ